jgi:integrase/recombinase XerD
MNYKYACESLQPEEADRLCQACESLEEKLIVWTLLDTGMRISELCNLKGKQVLRRKKIIRIQGEKSKKRVVPMSKRVQTLLEHLLVDSTLTSPVAIDNNLDHEYCCDPI